MSTRSKYRSFKSMVAHVPNHSPAPHLLGSIDACDICTNLVLGSASILARVASEHDRLSWPKFLLRDITAVEVRMGSRTWVPENAPGVPRASAIWQCVEKSARR